MTILQIIFWVLIFFISWVYLGYPIILWLISTFQSKEVNKKEFSPKLSLVIVAYNEEKWIRKKIDNTLASNYPSKELEIIVVSDGSTDKTEEIVDSYREVGVKLLAISKRHGKHYGQGRGIQIAKNDIVILTDATTFLQRDALCKIVRNFADPQVGCVSGEDRIEELDSKVSGEGIYVRYEMNLRSLESKVGSLVGVSGCFFALRKELCRNWIDNFSSDFYIPIMARMSGYRSVLEREAIGYYKVTDEPQKEFPRKVRTIVHGIEVLIRFKRILNPFKYGLFSLQMISHKLLRWLVPLYLIFLFWTNLLILNLHIFFLITLILQFVFYLLAVFAFLFKGLKNIPVFGIPLFFVMANYSIIVAWHNFIIGNKFVLWEPTKR